MLRMLLDETRDWTTIDAYVPRKPSRLALVFARAEWLWLEWQAGAGTRHERRERERLRAAARNLPLWVREDIGLM
jgi:hypothetical protein